MRTEILTALESTKPSAVPRFPEIDLRLTVDLSKNIDRRLDQAFATDGDIPDVVALQSTFDFDEWKAAGRLLEYKPAGFAAQKEGYADPDGAFVSAFVFNFIPTYSGDDITEADAPTSYLDYLDPRFSNGALALPYPHDDDAVLYVYDKLRKHFGEDYLLTLKEQDPQWVRGTAAPSFAVGREFNDTKALGNLTGYFGDGSAFIPEGDEPFLTWTQRMGILADAPNEAAGQLLEAFVTSREFQSLQPGRPVRDDLEPSDQLPHLEDIGNTDPLDFTAWLSDRANVATVREDSLAR